MCNHSDYESQLMKQEGFISFAVLHKRMCDTTSLLANALAAQRRGCSEEYLKLLGEVTTETAKIEKARLKNQEIMNSFNGDN